MKPVDLVGIHIDATSGAPLVLLREQEAPHRVLPIFVGGPEATSIAVALSGQSLPRPLTHDVMASLVQSLDAHVDAVEVTDLRDGSFQAAIALRGPTGDRRLDTRPSDAIALAVRVGAPLFVSEEVLDQAGALILDPSAAAEADGDGPDLPAVDEAAIEEAVAEFREFLDDLDPAAFADADAGTDADADADADTAAEGEDEDEAGAGREGDGGRGDAAGS